MFDIAVPAAETLDILNALPSGAGILLQDFAANDLQQTSRILEPCIRRKLTVAVNFPLRYSPFVRVARNLIAQGVIGDLRDLEICITVYAPWHLWPYLKKRPWAEILYHSIHYLDLVRSFLGEPNGVCARTIIHPKAERLAATRTSVILD